MHVLRFELKIIHVTITSDFSPISPEAVLRAGVDVAFMRAEPPFDLSYELVDHEPLIVLMPSDHRLTSRKAINPRQFVGEIFIRRSNKASSAARRDRGIFHRSGLDIKTGSWGGQHGDGHVPRCVHPRVGADARPTRRICCRGPW